MDPSSRPSGDGPSLGRQRQTNGAVGAGGEASAGVFGVALEELLARDREARPWLQVPLFVKKALTYLTAYGLPLVGIFKAAGSGPEVQRFQEEINSGEAIDFTKVEDVNTVSSLLKTFLRRLPDPLLTAAQFERWTKASEIRDGVERVQEVARLVAALPPANRAVLAELTRLLHMVHLNFEKTRMDAQQLASLFAPHMQWAPTGHPAAGALDWQVRMNDLVALMIVNYGLLFEAEEEDHCSAKPATRKYGRFLRKMTGHHKSIGAVERVWGGDKWHVWSGDSAGSIRVWEGEDLRFLRQLDSGQGRIFSIKAVGPHVWTGAERSLQIRDARGVLVKEAPGAVYSICPIVQGNAVHVWTSGDAKLKVWNASKLDVHREINIDAFVLAMTQVDGQIWAACNDKKIRIFNTKTFKMEKEFEAHSRKVNDVVAGKDYVYTSSDDRAVSAWQTDTTTRVCKGKQHTGLVYGLAWSGQHLWSASWDKSIAVWESDLELGARLCGYHTDAVSSLLLIPCRRRPGMHGWLLVSASYDKTLCLWALPEGLCTLPQPNLPMAGSLAGTSLSATAVFHADSMAASHAFDRSMRPDPILTATTAGPMPSGTASMRLGAVDGRGGVTGGLERWEIDPLLIKNPGTSLGTGSFGTVFKAELHGKPVAVKKLSTQKFDDKTLDDFRKEVAIMSTLRHPNVLLFMGACTQPGNLLIVTELMPRGSVYDLLRDRSLKLSLKRKMLFAKDAALGVNWLHRSKPQFLHLDLKAANLLVDRNWTVKVADFGLSVVKKDAAAKKEKHGPIGTPLWMAPEVLMNKEYNEKADVYSFGIVLWEILSGQDPWAEIESLAELVEAVCVDARRPVLPRDIPLSLRDLINACWHGDMDQRPSFEEIIPRFDYIIIDGLLPDPMARQLWRDRFLGMTTVSWRAFAEAFSEVIRVPLPKDPRDIKWQCLRRVAADPRDEQQVSLESFAKMLHWFGPLAEPSVLDRIHDLLRERYFHGEISSQEAERRMGGEKKGTFLLRFSSRDLGCYALTVVDGKGALKHYRITHSPGSPYAIGKVECPSLDALIKRYNKELNLKRPCPGSPYEPMFIAHDRDQVSLGYQAVE